MILINKKTRAVINKKNTTLVLILSNQEQEQPFQQTKVKDPAQPEIDQYGESKQN